MSNSFSVYRWQKHPLVVLLSVSMTFLVLSSVQAGDPTVEFDMPPIVAGVCQDTPNGGRQVQFELRLSSLVPGDAHSRADQWIIRCSPHSRSKVIDYEPKTELQSGIEGPIKVTRTKEDSDSIGIAADASYSKLVGGHIGMDDQHKQTDSQQFNRIAPLRAVVAAGTIDRGQGVFFKMRETTTSVLEGEKRFRLTFEIPAGWRGDLVDVLVQAQRDRIKFSGQSEPETIQFKHFVVAVYCHGDDESQALAQRLAEQERMLRDLASRSKTTTAPWQSVSWKQALHSLTPWNESKDSFGQSSSWVERLLAGSADPLVDETIRQLQMRDRVAALNYHKTRKAFLELSQEVRTAEEAERLVSTKNGT